MSNNTPGNTGRFDATTVPYPTKADIIRPFGGMENFLLSYGLKIYNTEDVEEGNRIIDALREAEWDDRVESAKKEWEARNSGSAK